MEQVYLDILKRYWGYDGFRGVQADIVESIGAGHDTLGLMPTGGGKSITFQVPGLALEGVCLVVTPLIALMKDQVAHLRQRGILAAAVYSGMSHDDILGTLENCILGRTKFLYISPERLSSELFRVKLRHMKVSFITVDEAHCISQWGYDFRPAYLEIAEIRKELPQVPVLALTATATPQVADDICRRLSFRESGHVFRMSFERKNLYYYVRRADDKMQELLHILQQTKGSAIVYTRNREHTREVAHALTQQGLTAVYYHAGLTSLDKDVRQQAWSEGEFRIMVATNAFGMGIDKPDVRWVIHMDVPDSVEAYFQEAGRAGRDGKPAYAILLTNAYDKAKLRRRIAEQFPEKTFIAQIYEELSYFLEIALGDGFQVTREFNLETFCREYRHFPVPVVSALNILTRAGYIQYRDEDDAHSRVLFIVTRDELYRLYHVSERAERVLQALLRSYSGLFSQYVTVEEKQLAQQTGLSADEVYEILLDMTRQRILHYVPARRVPRVTYLMRRVESERLVIPPGVYEDRLEQYRQRMDAVIHYLEDTTHCRSQLLLAYFGEESKERCGHCDVCRAAQKEKPLSVKPAAAPPAEDLQQFILSQLSDVVPVPLHQLLQRGSREDFREAVQRLADEGRVQVTPQGLIRL